MTVVVPNSKDMGSDSLTNLVPSIPAWVPPLDTGQPNALDLNDLGTLPKANFAAANQIIPITYGRDRLYGQPFVIHIDSDLGYLYTAMTFCEGEILGFEKILIDTNDALVTGTAFEGVKNRGFEHGDKTGWDAEADQDGTVNATVSQNGDYGLNIPAQLATAAIQSSNRLLAPPEGTVMTIKAWAARNATPTSLPDCDAQILIKEAATIGGALNAGSVAVVQVTGGDQTVAGWQEMEITYTVPANVAEYTICMVADNTGTAVGSWDFDDVTAQIFDVEDDEKEAGIEVCAYTGSQTQKFDSMLSTALTGYVDDHPGLAYIVMRCPAGSTRGFPRLEAIIQGRKIYDPRKDDTAGALGPEMTFTRTGEAWFRDWEGYFRKVEEDEPRFDGARRVENILLESQTIDTAPWTNTSSPILVTGLRAPDSSLTAISIEDDNAAAFEGRAQSFTGLPDNNSRYTVSFHVKKTSGGTSKTVALNVSMSGGTPPTSGNIRVNTDTGVVGSGAAVSGVIDEGEYWRFWSTITNNDTGNTALSMTIYPATGDHGTYSDVSSVVGTATFWGFQMEDTTGQADPSPGEYIPTTTVPVARTFNTDREGHVLVGSRTVNNNALWSEDLSNVAWVQPLSAATIVGGQTDPNGGLLAQRVTAGGVDTVLKQEDLHTEGQVVTHSVWLKRVTGSGAIEIYEGNGTTRTDISATLTTSWQRFFVTGVHGAASSFFGINIAVSGDEVDVAFLQAELAFEEQVGPGEYQMTTTAPVSTTYTTDVQTGEPLPGGRGLMKEQTQANEADYSNDFTDAGPGWGAWSGTSVTEVAGLFPEYSGWQHLDVAGANHSRAQNQGTFTDAQTDCLSFILENVDATLFDVGIRDATAAAWVNLVRMNWADLTVNSTFGINGSSYVEDLGIGPNGGQLVRMVVTATGTAAGTGATGNTRSIYTYPCGGPTNTDTVIIHHAQFEPARSQASSPMVTTGATNFTRANEGLNTTDVSWYNQAGGTIYAKAQMRGVDPLTASQGNILSFHDGTSSERISYYTPSTDNAGFYMRNTAVTAQVNTQITDLFDNTRQHYLAATISAAGSDFYGSGVASTPDTTVTDMPVITQFAIGQLNSDASEPLNGFIQEVRYYDAIQDNEWLEDASLGRVADGGTNYDPSMKAGWNFARDMTLNGLGAAGGVGAHRVDDSSTWEFSQNPTLCFRDMVENFTGWDIHEDGVIQNANANDELVEGVPRRQLGLSMAKANTVDMWVKGHRTYMGAFLNWEGGKIRLIPNRPDVEAPGAVYVENTALTQIVVGDHAELDAGTGDLTLEVAFNVTSTATDLVIAGKKNNTVAANAGYWIQVNHSTGYISARISDGTNEGVVSDVTQSFIDGMWHTCALVIDRTGDTIHLVVDGVAGSTVSISGVTGSLSNAIDFKIGSKGVATLAGGSAGIDEVRVWNDIRTPAELSANRTSEIENPEGDDSLVGYWKLNEGSSESVAMDSSGNDNDGTLGGAAVFGTGYQQVIPYGVAMHITSDDIVKDSLKLKRRSLRSVPNSVAIDYEDSSGTRWFTGRTQADSVRVTNGDEARRLSRVSLPGIHNASQAQREATERLNWYLTDLDCSLTLFDEGWNLTHGSIVAVTHPIGLDAKLFRVRQTSAASGRWTVDLTEYDPAVYSDDVVADPTIPDTNLGDPLNPPTVTGLTLAEELFNYKTGTTGSRVRVSWNATGFPFLSQYLVEGYVAGAKVWQTTTAATNIVSPPVEEIVDTIGTPTDYEVRVSVQSPFASGAAAIGNVQIDGKFAIPGDPTGATVTQTFADGIDLHWQAAVDIDIWRYEVRRGTTSDTWATATSLIFKDGLDFQETGLAIGTHRYFIKAIDSVKQESANAAQVDVTLSAPTAVAGLFGFEVASEVRLNWNAVTGEFAERYRIAYSDYPIETFETTLDVVDTIRFSTKDVPEGTFTFKAYTQDKVGNEAATAAEIVIEVTSDADAFLADSHDFVNPTLTNMVEWDVRLDDLAYYVTNMGDAFAVSPTDFVASDPLANYHSVGASEWLSETHDFGLLLTGSWNLTHDTTSLQGNFTIELELSTDDVTYVAFAGSAKGEFRYARVRIATVASPGTATAFVKSPIMNLKINVVPLEESGSATSSPVAGVGKTINLTREYTALKEITTQPKNTIASGSAVTSIVDNIVIGPNTAIQCNGTEYYAGGDWAELDFIATDDFTIEFITRHDGSSDANSNLIVKRNGSLEGFTIRADYNLNDIEFLIDDGTNQVSVNTTGNALPDDGEMHHFAIVVDQTAETATWYVDSVAQTPVSISSVTGSLASSSAIALFAVSNGTAIHPSGGVLDQVRFWDAARTTPQIEANYNIALDMTQTQTNLVHYLLCDGSVGDATGDITDVTTNARTYTATGAGDNIYVDPGNTGPNIQKINSFDVFIFDTFGQQLAEEFQWKWKAV